VQRIQLGWGRSRQSDQRASRQERIGLEPVAIVDQNKHFYLLVLFPDGHLPSRRWRVVAWLSGGALAVGLATAAVQPGTTVVLIGDLGPIRNPLGWQQAAEALGVVNGAARGGWPGSS